MSHQQLHASIVKRVAKISMTFEEVSAEEQTRWQGDRRDLSEVSQSVAWFESSDLRSGGELIRSG
jgi:hypothetical protein